MKKILAGLTVMAMLSGCASITQGTKQTVSVEVQHGQMTSDHASTTPGYVCKLQNKHGSWTVTPPASVEIHKGAKLITTCTRGTETGTTYTVPHMNGMTFGNAVFGGLVGMIIDTSNGAAFRYPAVILVRMMASSDDIMLQYKDEDLAPIHDLIQNGPHKNIAKAALKQVEKAK